MGREAGRRLFGADIDAYERGRPGHPPRVYELLVERCGLAPGTRVLEVGPGTGQATRRLLELGADVLAVEPDERLAAYLRSAIGTVAVLNQPLEDAELAPESFDLAVAASSFHWIDEETGLARVAAALRPGGWVALWWSHFGAEEPQSPFQQTLRPVIDELFAARGIELEESPAVSAGGGPRFGLDVEGRLEALAHAGFEHLEHELIPWSHIWDAARIRALFATFSPIIRLDEETRLAALDIVEQVAERDFVGRVELPVLTALYTARRPA
jgi:SAM-dependent methyltransferase